MIDEKSSPLLCAAQLGGDFSYLRGLIHSDFSAAYLNAFRAETTFLAMLALGCEATLYFMQQFGHFYTLKPLFIV
ncbi:hypothetical protein PAENIP36_74610 [Paenibacillus sp. P36]